MKSPLNPSLLTATFHDDYLGTKVSFHKRKKVDHCTCSQTWGGDLRLISLCKAFTRADLKSTKRQSSEQCLLHFWDLHIQKLLEKCWWNEPLLSSLLWTPYEIANFNFYNKKLLWTTTTWKQRRRIWDLTDACCTQVWKGSHLTIFKANSIFWVSGV